MKFGWRAAAAVVVAVTAQVAVAAPVAQAAPTHRFLYSFGSFSDVQGVAVDQASGDVYVYDSGAEAIDKFNAAGEPVEFSSTGSNKIQGVQSSGTAEGELAIASSGPAAGDIYVAHGGTSGVLIYDEAGEKIGTIEEAAGVPWGETCGVAVDPQGNVYVGIYAGDVNEYRPAGNPVSASDYVHSIEGAPEPCNVALDSNGDLFAARWPEGPVWRYESTVFGESAAPGSEVSASGSTLAVDRQTEEVYVDERHQISQFGARGEPFEAPVLIFAASGPGAIGNEGQSLGIAVDDASGDVYVSDGKGAISVFGPAVILPQVTTAGASRVSATAATLAGAVNPEGVSLQECFFEYGSGESYGHAVPCTQSALEIGSGSEVVTVEAQIGGLALGSDYHYRLVATNANGSVQGEDQTLTTQLAVGEEFVSGVSAYGATLEGSLQPGLQNPARYRFLYGLTSSYGASVPVEYEYAPPTAGNEIASQRLMGLAPVTTYHYALAAVNRDGEVVVGADQTFTTAPLTLPTLGTEGAPEVGQTSATLTGAIDPEGLLTTYSYEYGPTGAYGLSWPIAGAELGAGNEAQRATITIDNLQPGVTYHYRLVASNEDGATYGPDETFTTQAYQSSIIRLVAIPESAFPQEKKTATTTTKSLTNSQKLSNALKACHKDKAKVKRSQCETSAKNRYGPVHPGKRK